MCLCILSYTAVLFPVIGCLNSSVENTLNWLIPSYLILCLPHGPVAGGPVQISVRKNYGFEGLVLSRVHCEAKLAVTESSSCLQSVKVINVDHNTQQLCFILIQGFLCSPGFPYSVDQAGLELRDCLPLLGLKACATTDRLLFAFVSFC